jgi:hypothetical protein
LRDLLNHVAFADDMEAEASPTSPRIGRRAIASDYLQVLRPGEGPIAILVYAVGVLIAHACFHLPHAIRELCCRLPNDGSFNVPAARLV